MGGLHSTFPIVIESSNTPISAYICLAALVYALSPPFNRELDWIIHWLSSLEKKRVGERRDVQIQWIPLDWSEKDSGMEKRWDGSKFMNIFERRLRETFEIGSHWICRIFYRISSQLSHESSHSIQSLDPTTWTLLVRFSPTPSVGLKNRIKVN